MNNINIDYRKITWFNSIQKIIDSIKSFLNTRVIQAQGHTHTDNHTQTYTNIHINI